MQPSPAKRSNGLMLNAVGDDKQNYNFTIIQSSQGLSSIIEPTVCM